MRPVLCGLYTENIPMSARLASACAFVTIMRNSYTQTMRPRAAFFLLLLLFSLAGSAASFSATCIHRRTFWAPRPSSSSEKSRLGRTFALSLAFARFLLHAWIALTATAQDRTGESSTRSWSSSGSGGEDEDDLLLLLLLLLPLLLPGVQDARDGNHKKDVVYS